MSGLSHKGLHGAGCDCASKCTDKFFCAEGRTARTIYWGDKCIRKERAIVEVDVFISNLKPPLSFVSKTSPSDSWDKKLSLGELELMVQTCN
jgi:hypothetical protein